MLNKLITIFSIVIFGFINFGCSNSTQHEQTKEIQVTIEGEKYCNFLSDRAIFIKNDPEKISSFNIEDYRNTNNAYNFKNMKKIEDVNKSFNGTNDNFKSEIYNKCLDEKWKSQEYTILDKTSLNDFKKLKMIFNNVYF